MQVKTCCILLLLFLTISKSAIAVTIFPETPTEIAVSNRDLNRLVAPEAIDGIYSSEEHGLISQIDGKNAFLKFKVCQDSESTQYFQEELTIFVNSGGENYTLRLKPKNIKSQTIFLSNPNRKAKKNNNMYGAMSLEERITDLTVRTIKNDFLDSFTVKSYSTTQRQWFFLGQEPIFLMKVREVIPDGLGIKLTEFIVQAKVKIVLHEKQFLNTKIGTQIIGVTLENRELLPDEKSHLYVVTLHGEF